MKIITALFLYLLINNSYCATFEDGLYELTKKNYTKAYSILMPLAETGDQDAQLFIGSMYNFGQGVEKNENEAFKWFKLAAEQGLAEGQLELSKIYNSKKNYKEAFKWGLLAAKQNESEAQAFIGNMYLGGLGIIKNEKEAFKWIELSTENQKEKGKLDAFYLLGLLYEEGIGTKKNIKKAAEMYKKSIQFLNENNIDQNIIPQIQNRLSIVNAEIKNIAHKSESQKINIDPLNIR
jgi:hypothetical protein